MKYDDLIRIYLLTMSGQPQTFRTNLQKLILITLYVSNSEKTIDEIRHDIKERYKLEFTNEEIEKSIQRKSSDIIPINKEIEKRLGGHKEKVFECSYKLSDNAIKKFDEKANSPVLDSIVKKFVEENNCENENFDWISNVLSKFIFDSFNSNKNIIFMLLNEDRYTVDELIGRENYTTDEKLLINSFLEWDNKEKNRFIFCMVSYCVDYCMLTLKKDNNILNNIFKKKRFYLDTNVIFTLLGLHNKQNKSVSKAFIAKCKENGIRIYVSNFTQAEVFKAIDSYIENLNLILDGNEPVWSGNYERFTGAQAFIIEMYEDWLSVGNKIGTIENFGKHLKKEARKLMREFTIDEFVSYETSKPRDFYMYVDSLYDYKSRIRKNRHQKSLNKIIVKNDINNFIRVKELRDAEAGKTFFDTNTYLISLDEQLIRWKEEKYPQSTPLISLPSVMHSLILKLSGRTDDDYLTFNAFLKVKSFDSIEVKDKRLPVILQEIQAEEEEVSVKDRILDEIYDNFDTTYYEIEEVKKIIETAKEKIDREDVAYKEGLIKEGKQSVIEDMVIDKIEKIKKRKEFFVKLLDKLEWGWVIVILLFIIILLIFWRTSKIANLREFIIDFIKNDTYLVVSIIIVPAILSIVTFFRKKINELLEYNEENEKENQREKICKKYKLKY